MMVIWIGFLQLLLTSLCQGQFGIDSPVLQTVSPVRPPQVFCILHRSAFEPSSTGYAMPLKLVNTKSCTHLYYYYGDIENDLVLTVTKLEAQRYKAIALFKDKKPGLKTVLAVGHHQTGTDKFKALTKTSPTLNRFTNTTIETLRKHKFDGIDVQWYQPVGTDDRIAMVTLFKALREAFEDEAKTSGKEPLLLTLHIDGISIIKPDGYDAPEISKYLNYIIVTAVDFYKMLEKHQVWHHSALYPIKSSNTVPKTLNLDHIGREWVKLGIPREKFILGMATYARSFTLAPPPKYQIGAPWSGAGKPGKISQTYGTIAYYDMCDLLQNEKWTYIWDEDQQVPFAYKDDQLAGFENERSIKAKVAWLKKEGLGGFTLLTMNTDDFNGTCGNGRFPLHNAAVEELKGYEVKLEYEGPFDSYYIDNNREATYLSSVLTSIATLKNQSRHVCPGDQFQCDNGQCFTPTVRCDGKPHCFDGSDETYSLCTGFPCSDGQFRCKYGGCVKSAKKCDRVQDCIDASDEDATLCANVTSPDGCVAPPPSPGTEYISGFCNPSDESPVCNAKSGSIMAFGSHLHVRCSDGYSLEPDASSVLTCSTNEVYTPYPPTTCQKTCSPLEVDPVVETECKIPTQKTEGRAYYRDVPCNRPMVKGTKVTLSCPLQFKQQKMILTCLENGEWDRSPTIVCEPVCGVKRGPLNQKIDGGSPANQTDYPWHAGIYWYDTTHEKYEYVCGGSLISKSTVITAAHCGFGPGGRYPTDQMFVALGKQKLQWDEENGNRTQRLSVKEVLIPPEYTGLERSFSFDVALVILADSVKFDDYVNPICINNLPSRFRDNDIGLVSGWGGTGTGAHSEDLNYAMMPYVPRKKCHDALRKILNTRILTHDKFCAGYVDPEGPKLGRGDSGGGLIYEDNGLFYVVGIVSTTLQRNNFRIAAYTNVSTHFDWIRREMT